MTEYTPSEDEFINAFVEARLKTASAIANLGGVPDSETNRNTVATATAEAQRGLAKIKADALRQMAEEFWTAHLDDRQKGYVRTNLIHRAGRIEQEP